MKTVAIAAEIDLNLIVGLLFPEQKSRELWKYDYLWIPTVEPARRKRDSCVGPNRRTSRKKLPPNAQTKDDLIFMHKNARRARERLLVAKGSAQKLILFIYSNPY